MQNPFGNNNQDFFNNLPIPPNYAKIVNDQGDIRIAKVGFSWTTLWFGFFPAISRGDWYNFLVMLFIDADYYLVSVVFGWQWMFALPFPAIFFGFVYNFLYFRHLFHKGYRPADQHSRELLTRAKYWK